MYMYFEACSVSSCISDWALHLLCWGTARKGQYFLCHIHIYMEALLMLALITPESQLMVCGLMV